MSDEDLVAKFLAEKGATKVAPGQRTMSNREIYKMVRGIVEKPVEKMVAGPGVRMIVGIDGKEYYINELGEWL